MILIGRVTSRSRCIQTWSARILFTQKLRTCTVHVGWPAHAGGGSSTFMASLSIFSRWKSGCGGRSTLSSVIRVPNCAKSRLTPRVSRFWSTKLLKIHRIATNGARSGSTAHRTRADGAPVRKPVSSFLLVRSESARRGGANVQKSHGERHSSLWQAARDNLAVGDRTCRGQVHVCIRNWAAVVYPCFRMRRLKCTVL